jgi:hypothetical protein
VQGLRAAALKNGTSKGRIHVDKQANKRKKEVRKTRK